MCFKGPTCFVMQAYTCTVTSPCLVKSHRPNILAFIYMPSNKVPKPVHKDS